MAAKPFALYTSRLYRLSSTRMGDLTLTRLRDGAALYFQPGDDAGALWIDYEGLDTVQPEIFDAAFNLMCEAYDDALSDPDCAVTPHA